MRGPKRANHIRKLFALSKEDDVRKCVQSAAQLLCMRQLLAAAEIAILHVAA